MDYITWSDFEKIEIRVGTVVEAQIPEGSNHLIQLLVDFGEFGKKVIFTGIAEWYQPENLLNKQFPFLINIQPRKMGNFGMSEGMILAAAPLMEDGKEKATVFLLEQPVPDGTLVR